MDTDARPRKCLDIWSIIESERDNPPVPRRPQGGKVGSSPVNYQEAGILSLEDEKAHPQVFVALCVV